MSQVVNTSRASSVPKGPFDPSWGREDSDRAERVLAWFDTVIWTRPSVCSNCFRRIKGNFEATVETRSGRRIQVDDSWRTEHATLEYGHDPQPDPPQTTCECGSMGGRAAYDTLAEQAMVDRVPRLVDRLEDAGYQVATGIVYDVVRLLATDPDYRLNDKRIFATAAALGVDKA